MSGYIFLWRSIMDTDEWKKIPFDEGKAWVDLLMMASWQIEDYGIIETTTQKLQNKWGWGNTRVRSFLNSLVTKSQIKLKTNRKQTAIEIVNFIKYQKPQTANKPQTNRKPNNDRVYIDKNKNNTYKKEEYIKEEIDKEEKFQIVTLTTEEYEKLCSLFTKQKVDDKIEDMNEYCVNNKKRYTSYYLALNKWLKRDVPQVPQVSKSVEQIRDYLKKQKEKEVIE
jgi:hypothetical protein